MDEDIRTRRPAPSGGNAHWDFEKDVVEPRYRIDPLNGNAPLGLSISEIIAASEGPYGYVVYLDSIGDHSSLDPDRNRFLQRVIRVRDSIRDNREVVLEGEIADRGRLSSVDDFLEKVESKFYTEAFSRNVMENSFNERFGSEHWEKFDTLYDVSDNACLYYHTFNYRGTRFSLTIGGSIWACESPDELEVWLNRRQDRDSFRPQRILADIYLNRAIVLRGQMSRLFKTKVKNLKTWESKIQGPLYRLLTGFGCTDIEYRTPNGSTPWQPPASFWQYACSSNSMTMTRKSTSVVLGPFSL
jgi:hypothetical protein